MKRIHLMYGTVIALLLVVIGLLGRHYVVGAHAPLAEDQRQAIALDSAERALVLTEMRGFLEAVHQIGTGIEKGDMAVVVHAARTQGMQATHHVPGSLATKLPLEFKQLGFGVHQDFDGLARDAEGLGDKALALSQLNGILGKCVSCHARFQFAPAPAAVH
jgi:hypothetical protein